MGFDSDRLFPTLDERLTDALRALEAALSLLEDEVGYQDLQVRRYEEIEGPIERAVLEAREAREVIREWNGGGSFAAQFLDPRPPEGGPQGTS